MVVRSWLRPGAGSCGSSCRLTLNEDASLEAGSGTDKGDEVGRVDRAPAVLCGLDQLERHRQARGP
jgi:hypothetical protein